MDGRGADEIRNGWEDRQNLPTGQVSKHSCPLGRFTNIHAHWASSAGDFAN